MKKRSLAWGMRALAVGFVWVCWGGGLHAEEPAVLQMEFTNQNLVPSHWVVKIHPDGSARFDSDGGPASAEETGHIAVWDIHRDFQLGSAFTDQAFLIAKSRKLFNFPCESHLKVAFQGTKRLSYSGPEGNGSCEFNYSKDKEIESLGNSMMALEYTIVSGARLEKLLLHDRLGLDKELEDLQEAFKEGNAATAEAIRDVLTRIADDDEVMDRARKRARMLLAQVH
jgi:hypothetical protein